MTPGVGHEPRGSLEGDHRGWFLSGSFQLPAEHQQVKRHLKFPREDNATGFSMVERMVQEPLGNDPDLN